MPRKWYQKVFRSVFTKLLVIIIAAGIALNLVVAGFFVAHRHMAEGSIHQNLVQYLDYLITDIGTPPSVHRARKIAARTLLKIHYHSPRDKWSTAGIAPDLRRGRFYAWKESPDIRFGRYRSRSFVEVNRNDGFFIFEFAKPFDRNDRRDGLFLLLLVLIVAILGLAFLTIRKVLKPVKWLHEGVREVSRGNLEHRVPLKKHDELRELAEAFNAMTERIREMLQAKEQLLLDVSHEIRSPMARIKVALEFMQEGKVKESIREDLKEMEKMVSDILEAYRSLKAPGAMKLKKVDLAALIDDVASIFEGQPPGVDVRGITATVSMDVDPEKIKTVLQNIIANGIKFSDDDADPVAVSLTRQEAHAVIEIKDHGAGIPEEALPYVFEPFYRVDSSRSRKTGGYGLGLSLSKAIIEAHGGKIVLRSRAGQGTCVSLYLSFPTENSS